MHTIYKSVYILGIDNVLLSISVEVLQSAVMQMCI